MSELVTRSDKDGLATLTLNRPEKLNALNGAAFLELDAHLAALANALDSVGAVVLRGAGKCFSVGLDLGEAASGQYAITPLQMAQIVERLGSLPQPLIAAVHGYCFTGALEFALAADVIVAAESAAFADTHAKFGLTPAWGLSQRLPRRVGRGHASRMMFTGATVSASEALAIGLIDVCLPDESFEAELATFVSAVVANSWFSHRGNKRLMRETEGLPLAAGLAYEFSHRPGRAPDFEERVARFTKR